MVRGDEYDEHTVHMTTAAAVTRREGNHGATFCTLRRKYGGDGRYRFFSCFRQGSFEKVSTLFILQNRRSDSFLLYTTYTYI